MATLLILEPIFEADFLDCSYGFRSGRSAHEALEEIRTHLKAGYQAVYDADLKGYFDSIPHRATDGVCGDADRGPVGAEADPDVAEDAGGGTAEGGDTAEGEPEQKGTPQGGVISPLLANLYLHWFDKVFHRPRRTGAMGQGQAGALRR